MNHRPTSQGRAVRLVVGALWLPSLAMAATFAACGSDEEANGTPDASLPDTSIATIDATGAIDATTADATTDAEIDAEAEADADADADAEAEADAEAAIPITASCRALHAVRPALPSGIYTIDPDGAGPVEAQPVFCDMVFDGGGFTLIFSSIAGADSIFAPGDAGSDASPDAAYYLRPPAPGALGAFKGEFVKPLAEGATQVHIRTPFEADAGADGGDAWITSTVLADGGLTLPIMNLRSLKVLNANAGLAYDFWTGPNAIAARLGYQASGGCSPVDSAPYPMIYWACNNAAGLHIDITKARWVYVTETSPNEAMEVYVR